MSDEHDVQMLDIKIDEMADGFFHLQQGQFGGDDDNLIYLHPHQMASLAKLAGDVPASAVKEAEARVRERLELLGRMVVAQTRPSDPLRAAITTLVPWVDQHLADHSRGTEKPLGSPSGVPFSATNQAPTSSSSTLPLPGL